MKTDTRHPMLSSALSALLSLVLASTLAFTGCVPAQNGTPVQSSDASVAGITQDTDAYFYDLSDVPEYSDSPYVEINYSDPDFSTAEITANSYENYSPLDSFGRCGVAEACIGQDIMPTEERRSVEQVKPTGWHLIKYDCVEGKYLYNRCHLIGYQLTAENANERNLITGTRYLNVEGMLPFENKVADYVERTGNHVMYRVTPIFNGDDLVARGVQMEAFSVEDDGAGVKFNVYCYNVQPGVDIDYATGDSRLTEEVSTNDSASDEEVKTYVLNTDTKKFHNPNCASAKKISEENKKTVTTIRSKLIEEGYSPCGNCNP